MSDQSFDQKGYDEYLKGFNKPDQKITRTQAIARVKEGERVEFASCPHCSGTIAVYIKEESQPSDHPTPTGTPG